MSHTKTFPQAEAEARRDETRRLDRKEFERRAFRHQADQRGDEISAATGTDYSNAKDMTRQEYAADADINNLATKFNLDELRKPINWGGEVDTTIDLQQSLTAITESKQAYNRLHPDIRDKYPTWQLFLEGMDSGKLADDLAKMGLNNVAMQHVKEIDDELDRTDRKETRIRERQAAELAERVKRGEKFTPATEGKPKD